MRSTTVVRRILKPAAFLGGLVPFGLLLADIVRGTLGTNPVEALTHRTGFAALLFLTITLAVTPLRKLTGIGALIQLRRMLGLFAFFYGCLHLLVYGLDRSIFEGLGLSPAVIIEDIAERPYITVGFTVWVFLLALALTSTNGWVRRLGGKRWQRLHRLIYPAAIGAVVHFWWLVKADIQRPLIFGIIIATLLGYRIVTKLTPKRARATGTHIAEERIAT